MRHSEELNTPSSPIPNLMSDLRHVVPLCSCFSSLPFVFHEETDLLCKLIQNAVEKNLCQNQVEEN